MADVIIIAHTPSTSTYTVSLEPLIPSEVHAGAGGKFQRAFPQKPEEDADGRRYAAVILQFLRVSTNQFDVFST